MKKHLAALALFAGLTLAAQAQTSYLTNQGNMSFVFYVTNMPPSLQRELEDVIRIHNRMVTTNSADWMFTPSYRLMTNSVTGTDTNGEPVTVQVVTTNVAWSRQGMLNMIADPKSPRVQANLAEIMREWLADRRRIFQETRTKE